MLGDANGVIAVKVVYEGVSYAIFVHEILANKHPIGEAKFLENALRASARMVIRIIRKELRG